jgi:hypothetical protein
MQILGAGLAGLLAGCHFPNIPLFEAGTPDQIAHKAVLRFRTSAVGDSVGIEFKKVRVRKGIWSKEEYGFCDPNIRLANNYAKKVIGSLVDRSIWDLEPVDRYIAPENFQQQLVDRLGSRIHWGQSITRDDLDAFKSPTISTIPLKTFATWYYDPALYPNDEVIRWGHAPIAVRRFRIQDADVYQTVYFPDPETSLYRVSITGNLVIAEYANAPDPYDFWTPFGLSPDEAQAIDTTSQRFGKILPIDDAWRKAFIFSLSQRKQIYSLGRYGVWRNILLDDVLQDIAKVKKLIVSSPYAQQLAAL